MYKKVNWKFVIKCGFSPWRSENHCQDSNDFTNCADINLCLHSYLFPSQTEFKAIGHHNTCPTQT